MTKSVFISSTSRDLGEYREAVDKAIRRLELHPINMDDFGSQPGGASGVSLREVAKADMFVGIVAKRYGYVPHESANSITEQEYDEAVRRKVPRLMYLVDPTYNWPQERIEQNDVAQNKLAAFRLKVESTDVRSLFTTPDDLAAKVTADLVKLQLAERRKDARVRLIIGAGVMAALLLGVIIVANPFLRGVVGGVLRPLPAVPTATETALAGGVLMTAAPARSGPSASALLEQAVQAYEQGQLNDAIAAFTSAIELEPENAAAYSGRGLAYADLDKLDEALADYNRAIELDPNYIGAYGNRGLLYLEQGERPAAAADFGKLIRLNTDSTNREQITANIGDTLAVEIVGGHAYRITFEASSGQVLTLSATAEEDNVDPLIVLLNEDGAALDGDDDGGGDLDARITNFTVPADGTYTLLLSHTLDGEPGAVEVSIEAE